MEYKRIKQLVPFCKKCNQEIRGNGSVLLPYECKCGKWEWDGNDYVVRKVGKHKVCEI